MTETAHYSAGDLLRLTHVVRNQLTHWTDTHLLTASIREADGRGKHRRFSRLNLVEAMVLRQLVSLGVPRNRLWKWVGAVSEALQKHQSYLFVDAAGRVRHCEEFPLRSWSGASILIVDLAQLGRELDGALDP